MTKISKVLFSLILCGILFIFNSATLAAEQSAKIISPVEELNEKKLALAELKTQFENLKTFRRFYRFGIAASAASIAGGMLYSLFKGAGSLTFSERIRYGTVLQPNGKYSYCLDDVAANFPPEMRAEGFIFAGFASGLIFVSLHSLNATQLQNIINQIDKMTKDINTLELQLSRK